MIRKFAMLAATAAIFVACSSNVEDDSTMDAAQDNATEMMDKAQEDAKDAAATIDSTTSAQMDTVKQSMEEATDAANNAVDKANETKDGAH